MTGPPTPGARPDADRLRLLRSTMESSPLASVAEAMAVASLEARRLYVERREGGWRWSPVSRGGASPLLRETARILLCDHGRIQIAFRALEDGSCILTSDPAEQRTGVRWTILELDGPISPGSAAERVGAALGPAGRKAEGGQR